MTLALLANTCGGVWFKYWLCIDAFLVLSGSVLTAFVGVTGLVRRLALDRCMPQLMLQTNPYRGTNHVIILGFLLISSTLYLVLNGDVSSLANVYSLSFLCVMSLFAIANMLLKYKRAYLPRQVKASWLVCICALCLVIIALVGVIVKDTSAVTVWLLYFIIVASCFSIMFLRAQALRIMYYALHSLSVTCQSIAIRLLGNERGSQWFNDGPALNWILKTYHSISNQPVIFFVSSGLLSIANKAILYCKENEETHHIRIVHVYEQKEKIPAKLLRNVNLLDEEYPRLKIDLVLVRGIFGPEMINFLSDTLTVPKNLMFMACPREDFKHKMESLGGVRIIAR